MSPQPLPKKAYSQGFALAAVLWLLAGLSIVVAMIADVAQTSAERAALLRKRSEFIRSSMTTRAQAQYWLSTAQAGLAEFTDGNLSLQVDGTPYKADETSLVQFQDMGGLVNLASIDQPFLTRFLEDCGVSPDKTPYLIDALLDYVDADNLQRLHGAEQEAYASAGMPPPRNSPLLTVEEVWAVYGWGPYRQAFEDNGCIDDFTIHGETTMLGTSLNLATAPPRVLKAAGLGAEQIDDISRARGDPQHLAERTAQNNQLAGVNIGGWGALTGKHVQRSLRVTHLSTQGPWQLSYILQLDPMDKDRPWRTTQAEIKAMREPMAILQGLPWPPAVSVTTPNNAPTNSIF